MSEAPATNPAEFYESYFVPGNFGRSAPLILERARVRRGDRLLDVGCGTGVVARTAAPVVGEVGRVVGLDPNPMMLEVARDLPRADGAPVEWVEGEAASPPPGPFDVVTCQHALQFVPDRDAAVRAMNDVLASGGRAAISVWRALEHQPVYAPLIEAEARQLGVPVDELAEPFAMGDPAELRALLEEGGFSEVEVQPLSHTVRFPEPERFVRLTMRAAAAVLPAFAEMDEHAQEELLDAVERELEPVLQEHVEDDAVVFRMHAQVALARR